MGGLKDNLFFQSPFQPASYSIWAARGIKGWFILHNSVYPRYSNEKEKKCKKRHRKRENRECTFLSAVATTIIAPLVSIEYALSDKFTTAAGVGVLVSQNFTVRSLQHGDGGGARCNGNDRKIDIVFDSCTRRRPETGDRGSGGGGGWSIFNDNAYCHHWAAA